jgi:uncharacterized membrane-anchored protein YhcB (DUF1043 family)
MLSTALHSEDLLIYDDQAVQDTDDKAKATLDGLLSRMRHVSAYFAKAIDEDSKTLLNDYAKYAPCYASVSTILMNGQQHRSRRTKNR